MRQVNVCHRPTCFALICGICVYLWFRLFEDEDEYDYEYDVGQNSPTTFPSASMSICAPAGSAGRAGMVAISPASG